MSNFRCIRIRFRPLDGAMGMMRRRVDSVQLERFISDICYIMPCSGRNCDGIAAVYMALIIQRITAASHLGKSVSGFNTQELIRIRMDFQTDFTAYRNIHQCYLK